MRDFLAGGEDLIVERLKILKQNGHPIVMDDYIDSPAQNARLARLLHKEDILSGIKLDRDCVRSIVDDEALILDTLPLSLGRRFKVVAEQAKLEDLPLLAQKGITHSQSYETGRPTPWKKALMMVKNAFSTPAVIQNPACAIA